MHISVNINISTMQTRYTNFEIWKIIKIGIDMYIYYWSEGKKKTFSKKSVRPSVRAQKLCTLQLKVKIIECGVFVWKVYTGNRNCQNFDPNARRLTKLEPNEIFNDFAILGTVGWNQFKLFFILKIWTGKYHQIRVEDFRSWSRINFLLEIS